MLLATWTDPVMGYSATVWMVAYAIALAIGVCLFIAMGRDVDKNRRISVPARFVLILVQVVIGPPMILGFYWLFGDMRADNPMLPPHQR